MVSKIDSAVEASPSLRAFVRKGVEGGCIACRKPITAHVDARGTWIGCQAPALPHNIPFFLIPDRRLMGRRVTPEPRVQLPTMVVDRRHTPSDPEPQPAPVVQRRAAATTAPQPRAIVGPQVVYVARYPLDASPIQRLPEHDRKVYGLIARHKANGATRKALLDALDASRHTGRVDGAVRRLRLRKVIQVREVARKD